MSTWQPYYRRYQPIEKFGAVQQAGLNKDYITWSSTSGPPAGAITTGDFTRLKYDRDKRVARMLYARVGKLDSTKVKASELTDYHKYSHWTSRTLLQDHLTLAVLAFGDYFSANIIDPKMVVSKAILNSEPGWCGAIGADQNQASVLQVPFSGAADSEGNFDMGMMFLLAIAYGYFPDLSVEARTHLIKISWAVRI